MNLNIVNRSRSEISKSFVKNWIAKLSARVPELKKYSDLTLVFVSSAEMKLLNKKYRGKDYATDVLSFQPIDFQSMTIDDSAVLSEDGWGNTQTKSRSRHSKKPLLKPKSKRRRPRHGGPLGELVFCLSVIKRQAKAHELTFEQELGYMIIHGTLHLLGYEHENGGAPAKKMFKLQDQTFAKLIK